MYYGLWHRGVGLETARPDGKPEQERRDRCEGVKGGDGGRGVLTLLYTSPLLRVGERRGTSKIVSGGLSLSGSGTM